MWSVHTQGAAECVLSRSSGATASSARLALATTSDYCSLLRRFRTWISVTNSDDNTKPSRRIPGLEAWGHIGDDESQALKELELLSDRAAGIVAVSILERHLTLKIREMLILDNKEADEALFRDSGGPLYTFSAKTSIAYALGLISEQGLKDLTQIRKIRNDFAHDIPSHTFDTQSIKDRCFNLKLVDEWIKEAEGLPTNITTHDLVEAVMQGAFPSTKSGGLSFVGANEALKDARSRFFLSINCMIACTELVPRRLQKQELF